MYEATETKPAIRTHACDAQCPVAQSMDKVFEGLNDRIERAVEDELEQTTIADIVSRFVSGPAKR